MTKENQHDKNNATGIGPIPVRSEKGKKILDFLKQELGLPERLTWLHVRFDAAM